MLKQLHENRITALYCRLSRDDGYADDSCSIDSQKGKDFSHRQGSGYISNNKMSSADIVDLKGDMQKEFDWSGTCIKKIDVTNVGAQYDLTELLISDDSDDTFSI